MREYVDLKEGQTSFQEQNQRAQVNGPPEASLSFSLFMVK